MSATDSWIKLYRWWQEHLKPHFNLSSSSSSPAASSSSTVITKSHCQKSNSLLNRRSSLILFRSSKNVQSTQAKKRASFGCVEQYDQDGNVVSNGGFRHVYDTIRNKNTRITRASGVRMNSKRRRFNKSTTCDESSDDDASNENNSGCMKSTPKDRIRHTSLRRFSLVKLELPINDSISPPTDETKGSIPSSSPNLIQKLFFRQFSPKTRPYSLAVSSDESVPSSIISNDTTNINSSCIKRRAATPRASWSNFSSSNNHKQTLDSGDNLLSPPPNLIPPKNQQSELATYLSRRRNTTGSISLNKLVDLKNASTGNVLKLAATTTFSNSSYRIATNENIFQAVEESDLYLTKQLLQANDNLINSYNEHDWRPLDIAIMLNNGPMIQLLLQHGGEESLKLQTEDSRHHSVCQQLSILLQQNPEETIKSSPNKLTVDDVQARRSSPSSYENQRHRRASKCQQEQLQILQQQQILQQRTSILTQMKDNYEQAGIPDAPTNVRLMVTGSNSITVTYDEPHRSNGAMVIKYKIEWCIGENFDEQSTSDTTIQSDIVKNCFLREYVIRDLPVGQKCYVRVSAGNMRGFGPPAIANPPYCIPSSWREFSKTSRPSIWDLRFEEILNKIRPEKTINERPLTNTAIANTNTTVVDGNDLKTVESSEISTTVNSMRNRRRSYGNLRRNLRQLFQLYPRLAKTMKRGLYLVSVMLNGERILVTNEDVLPMIEVDENYGHNLLGDFQWFMKLTFVWDDLKILRPNLERCSSVTSFYLRMKLVQAAIELQTLEEMNNLGRLHHSYIRDNDGNVAFILINDLSSTNTLDTRTNISPSNLKWISIAKFFETMKENDTLTNNSCLQQITDKLPDMIDFYHSSIRRLDSGLYVAYLKMQNSVDCVRVMVNKYMPGSLPCIKIRTVANVSRDEWEWLHTTSDNNNYSIANTNNQDQSDENGLPLFKIQLREAVRDLCLMLNLPETHFSNSRIYDAQVVEIRDDLSLIIIMSTADEVNVLSTPSSSNQRRSISTDCLTPFMYLPVYTFEVLQHLSNNYRFISQYSRVSICLDFELICAQQTQREAFSTNELDESRYRLNHLLSCQQDLDDIWRSSRWLVDVINCAKDKSYAGISLKSWLTFHPPTHIHLKITSDSTSNYASDSALDAVKFSKSTLELPTTMTSTSLSSSFLNDSSLITKSDSGFIENDTINMDRHTTHRASTISTIEPNDPMELTVYIPILSSNTSVPFKIRTHKLTTSYELSQVIMKQQYTLLKSVSSLSSSPVLVLVWIRSTGQEHMIEDGATAGEIEKRLIRYGGQVHVRPRGLSTSRSSQPLNRSSASPRLPTFNQINSNKNTSNDNSNNSGSNVSLNV